MSRYWRLDFARKRGVEDPREIHEELRGQIRAATKRRLIADVPLGAFLSGGVDSSAVVAAMAEASAEPVKTFSIGFTSEQSTSCRCPGRRRAFGTDHHELMVEPNAIELIPRIVRHYGEPFADSSAIPTFYLAEMARGTSRSRSTATAGTRPSPATRATSQTSPRSGWSAPTPAPSAMAAAGRACPRAARSTAGGAVPAVGETLALAGPIATWRT